MLFKLLWNILKQLRWILPIALLGLVAYGVLMQYQTLKSSAFGNFLPQLPASVDLGKVTSFLQTTTTPTPTVTSWPSTIKLAIATKNGPVVFSAETAITPEKRDLGLMYRTSLPAYRGMLFVFEYPIQYGFWTKNCEIPLDMIFIDENKKIVDLKENVQPCKTTNPAQENCPISVPKTKYLMVLEIAGGQSKVNNISINDSISLTQ